MARKALPLFLILTMFLGGCSFLESREGYADVNDTYITVLEGLLEAQAAGKFSNEQWANDIVPIILLGDQLLDTYNAVTASGGEAPHTLEQLREVLLALNQFLLDKGYFTSG